MTSFFSESIFNLKYFIALLFLITSNIFIYFIIIENVFNIYFGKNITTVKFLIWVFLQIIILIITRCICFFKNTIKDKRLLG